MTWQDRITVDPQFLVGKPIVKGTRIAVEFVVDLLARGWSAEQILEEYNHLTREDVQACLADASDTLKSERVSVGRAVPDTSVASQPPTNPSGTARPTG